MVPPASKGNRFFSVGSPCLQGEPKGGGTCPYLVIGVEAHRVPKMGILPRRFSEHPQFPGGCSKITSLHGGSGKPALAWLGQSCPSSSRRRDDDATQCGLDILVQAVLIGKEASRRQNGCDNIPVVAGFLGEDALRRQERRRTCSAWLRQSCPSSSRRRDANATQVWFVGGTPTLRRCGSSAGTPTVRLGVARSVSVSLTKKRRRYDAKKGILPSFSVFSPAVEEG